MTRQRENSTKRALLGTLRAMCRDFRAPPGVLKSVAVDLFESLNTPISLSCEIMLRYDEVEQLVRKTVDPRDYTLPDRFRDDYQAVSFLKKAPLEIEGVDPLVTAKEKFFAAEVSCGETNARFRSLCAGTKYSTSPRVIAAISAAAQEVQRVLGVSVNSREWLDACRFGPGAFNHTEARGLTSLYDKLQVAPSVSHDMAVIGALLVQSQPQWARSVTDCEVDGFWPLIRQEDMSLVPGNRIAFVPKTAVTHRTIAI
uniref:RNA-directed RNA polymerase n=1 Tax=Leviviridae sp. TaxID=2027243 RepID=A0A514D1X1_9VIRU|nr:MAG: RNA-dependent RNA polymerase [Leviviridae sp.]